MPTNTERTSIKVAAERAVLVAVHLPDARHDPRDPLGELGSLARTAGAVVAAEMIQNRQRPEAGTYIGSGKLEDLKALCEESDASLVIFDNDLSPSQIGNIEKVLQRKVIDRSELILDIFASRATTQEAKAQVELAQLEYTYPRLRAMWSHLERIAGSGAASMAGIGTRGPGEQQLEIDRRIVQRKRTALQRELSEMLGRKRRLVAKRKVDHFTVGLVGYTNAGKSTLFNTITEGGAFAKDQLFSTLMTRTRQWDLGGGLNVMLSDTVGFVRDLPHNLVASFRATLEEATHADLLLIVLDVSDPAASMQYDTVMQTLDDLFDEIRKSDGEDEDWQEPERLLLLNKADLLEDNAELLLWQRKVENAIVISALPGADGALRIGAEDLNQRVREAAQGAVRTLDITIPLSDSKSVHTLENRAEVLDRDYTGAEVTLRCKVGARVLAQLRSAGARLKVVPVSTSDPAEDPALNPADNPIESGE